MHHCNISLDATPEQAALQVDQSRENYSSDPSCNTTTRYLGHLGTLVPNSLLWLFEDAVKESRACAGLLPLHQPLPLLLGWAVRTPPGCMAKLHGSSRWEAFLISILTGEERSRVDYIFFVRCLLTMGKNPKLALPFELKDKRPGGSYRTLQQAAPTVIQSAKVERTAILHTMSRNSVRSRISTRPAFVAISEDLSSDCIQALLIEDPISWG